VDYFKKRIQTLEKVNKEWERCKVYAKKKYYKEPPIDYELDLNSQSEKFYEVEERNIQSPKGGSVVNLNLTEEYEDTGVKPNHVEKLSMALSYSLKKENSWMKNADSKSVKSEHEESVSMNNDYDICSDTYNDKAKKELELVMSDLGKIRKDYEELSQQNFILTQKESKFEEKINSLEEKVKNLKQDKEELLIKERGNEKQIMNLHKRIDAAKIEILTLNSKLQILISKTNPS